VCGWCKHISKLSELPPLSAANTSRLAAVKEQMSGIKFILCNSGGTVDFIHPDLFRVIFYFLGGLMYD